MATATTTQEIDMTTYTLKNIKTCEWASEETTCFEATLYIDGKSIGRVHNEGCGGAHFYDFRTTNNSLDAIIDELLDQHYIVKDAKAFRNRLAKKYPASADEITIYSYGNSLRCCLNQEHVNALLEEDPTAVIAPTVATITR